MNAKTSELLSYCKYLVPQINETSHKGSSGRIGVFGGSVEFTGAPYFAGISALRTGADLVYVFSASSAAPVIKSYSPELMVLPYLDSDDASNRIFPWLKRLHSVLIGPGLGRHETVFNNIRDIINLLKVTPGDHGKYRPIVLDADGLHFLSHNAGILKDYPGDVYLTPNCVEFNNLVNVILGHNYQPTEKDIKQLCSELGTNITVILKGNVDLISDSSTNLTCDIKGSYRRCGGQGDLLSGTLATFTAWVALRKLTDSPPAGKDVSDNMLAAYSASYLTRTCSREAFDKHSRSMLASDMIRILPEVFKTHFES